MLKSHQSVSATPPSPPPPPIMGVFASEAADLSAFLFSSDTLIKSVPPGDGACPSCEEWTRIPG